MMNRSSIFPFRHVLDQMSEFEAVVRPIDSTRGGRTAARKRNVQTSSEPRNRVRDFVAVRIIVVVVVGRAPVVVYERVGEPKFETDVFSRFGVDLPQPPRVRRLLVNFLVLPAVVDGGRPGRYSRRNSLPVLGVKELDDFPVGLSQQPDPRSDANNCRVANRSDRHRSLQGNGAGTSVEEFPDAAPLENLAKQKVPRRGIPADEIPEGSVAGLEIDDAGLEIGRPAPNLNDHDVVARRIPQRRRGGKLLLPVAGAADLGGWQQVRNEKHAEAILRRHARLLHQGRHGGLVAAIVTDAKAAPKVVDVDDFARTVPSAGLVVTVVTVVAASAAGNSGGDSSAPVM